MSTDALTSLIDVNHPTHGDKTTYSAPLPVHRHDRAAMLREISTHATDLADWLGGPTWLHLIQHLGNVELNVLTEMFHGPTRRTLSDVARSYDISRERLRAVVAPHSLMRSAIQDPNLTDPAALTIIEHRTVPGPNGRSIPRAFAADIASHPSPHITDSTRILAALDA
jgi:hypothetical protein